MSDSNPEEDLAEEESLPSKKKSRQVPAKKKKKKKKEEIDPDLDPEFQQQLSLVQERSFFHFYFSTAQAILSHPKKFFAAMPKEGAGRAFLFLLVSALIYSSMEAIKTVSVKALISPLLSSLFTTCAGTLFVHFTMRFICRGKGTLKQTFMVLCYGKAPLLVAWLPLGIIPLGGIISIIYTLILNVVGLSKVHKRNFWLVLVITIFFSFWAAVVRGLMGR